MNTHTKTQRAMGLSSALALWAAVASLGGCKPPESKAMSAQQEVRPVAVETMVLAPQTLSITLEYPGVAEPIEERRVAAEASGRVLDAPFEEGKLIARGASMLRVDSKMSAAQIGVLKSQLRAAQRERDRAQQLAKEGLATPQQLDQANSSVEQLQLSIKQAELGVSMSSVRSPFGGYVLRKMVEPGEFVGAGSPIAHVINYETIVVKVHVPESAIRYVQEGQPLTVDFPAQGKQVQGVVKRRGVQAAQPTQTFPVEVHIDNRDLTLLPGMRAIVVLPKATLQDVLVVPRDAILEGVRQREAMVLTERQGDMGKASLRVVEFGEAKGDQVVITSGLKPQDQLIVLGHRGVVEGSPVRVVLERAAAQAAAKEAPKP